MNLEQFLLWMIENNGQLFATTSKKGTTTLQLCTKILDTKFCADHTTATPEFPYAKFPQITNNLQTLVGSINKAKEHYETEYEECEGCEGLGLNIDNTIVLDLGQKFTECRYCGGTGKVNKNAKSN